MKPSPIYISETGAARAQLYISATGRPVVAINLPIGPGRRLRFDVSLGQIRAVDEVVSRVVAEIDRQFAEEGRPKPRPTMLDALDVADGG